VRVADGELERDEGAEALPNTAVSRGNSSASITRGDVIGMGCDRSQLDWRGGAEPREVDAGDAPFFRQPPAARRRTP